MNIANAHLKLWTLESYQRLYEKGAFAPGERVELLEGLIIAMSPQDFLHGRAVSHGTAHLVGLFGETHYVRVQLPLNLTPNSQLEPDFALVLKELVDGEGVIAHPSTANLVIELSESSLSYDRNEKSRGYAQAGIPEYWIVNLKKNLVEVRKEPGLNDKGICVYKYCRIHKRGESLSPLFAPQSIVILDRLF